MKFSLRYRSPTPAVKYAFLFFGLSYLCKILPMAIDAINVVRFGDTISSGLVLLIVASPIVLTVYWIAFFYLLWIGQIFALILGIAQLGWAVSGLPNMYKFFFDWPAIASLIFGLVGLGFLFTRQARTYFGLK